MYAPYRKYTGKSELDKAVNSLLGIIEGISIDGVINSNEALYLATWLKEHRDFETTHPFTEFYPILDRVQLDQKLSKEQYENISWLCEKIRSTEFYDEITADLQRLQGILASIASDQVVSVAELTELSGWLSDHEHLRTRYPFDEIDSLITTVLQDHQIDPAENKLLLDFLNDFSLTPNVITGEITPPTLHGICAVAPVITFKGSRFCFTGESEHYSRQQLSDFAEQKGGKVVASVSKVLDYLVIGSAGNPCWKYACYGRKIEQVVQLRQAGAPILIVHESDFFDCLE